jgi:hypothetical protein
MGRRLQDLAVIRTQAKLHRAERKRKHGGINNTFSAVPVIRMILKFLHNQ